MNRRKILLTGASGYVGGRLLPLLEIREDLSLRCLTRSLDSVHPTSRDSVELVKGDLLVPESLPRALEGVDTAYFLVHALGSRKSFERAEIAGAKNFAIAAREAGVKRIVYLGGLGSGPELSPHLRTRHLVGEILRTSGVPTIEFRASMIVGSGSLSFELLRALTEKLPIMITPLWLQSLAQPIAIEDVLRYLVHALDIVGENGLYEIGGPDRVSYLDLIKEYARQRDLKRIYLPVPVLSPYLSSLWLGLVTPVYARVGRKLIDSLRNDTVVNDRVADTTFDIRPMSVGRAIERALTNEDREVAETRWSDAESAVSAPKRWGGKRLGSRIVDTQTIDVNLSQGQAFEPIRRIGGAQGWYFANWLWEIRGFLDLVIGGVGMRRGRSHPTELRNGQPIDFWRVESYVPNTLLRLRAEMRVPGRAWLQFEASPAGPGRTTLTQTAIFEPLGLWGLVYWYMLYPLHAVIFRGMLREITRRAVEGATRRFDDAHG